MGYTVFQVPVPLNGKRLDFLPCVRLSGSPDGKRIQTLKNKEKFYENNSPPPRIFSVVFAILMLVAFAACSDDDSGAQTSGPLTIDIAGIQGVAAPLVGGWSVHTITVSTQYTGTVSWSPNHATFMAGTNYTATITLTPKSGFTLTGVPADFFTVAGATSVSNSPDSGVITAIFPLPLRVFEIFSIGQIQLPNFGETPVTNFTAPQYTGTVTWSPPVANTFAADTVYTATITLTAQPGFILNKVGSGHTPTVAGATNVSQSPDDFIYTAIYPATGTSAAATVTVSHITNIPAPVVDANPVRSFTVSTQYTGTVSWSPDHATFIAGTSYTATISLTPQPGFTFTGVAEDFFTVAGATNVSNSADSGVVTAIFPATPLRPTTHSNLFSVVPPATGETPVSNTYYHYLASGLQYTGTVSWSPSVAPGSGFSASTLYTATITLTPTNRYTLSNVPADFFHVAGATAVRNNAGSGLITATFPVTGATAPVMISLSNITNLAPVTGATPVRTFDTAEYTGRVIWPDDSSVVLHAGGSLAADGTFGSDSEYTASIVLTAKPGYTLNGLARNFFKVEGASWVNDFLQSGSYLYAGFPRTR